ncbi:hypothetical protein K8I61_02290 [bacterium]|nr:hypothetical protein [bacterium]
MKLTSLVVIFWGIVLYLALRFLVPARFRPKILLFVSIFAIFSQGPILPIGFAFALVTFFVVAAGQHFARRLSGRPPGETRTLLRNAILAIVAPLVFFKAIMAILPPTFVRLADAMFPHVDIRFLAPLGISYLTFRVLAYVFEVRAGRMTPLPFARLLHYAAFWPTLISGPIERPRPFDEQDTAPPMTSPNLAEGLMRIASGAVKALMIGEFFGRIAKPLTSLTSPDGPLILIQTSVDQMWISTIAYYFHIYFNFAGYSDIAIGLALVFGYRIRENFAWPILATNIAAFWRRWHMSLTGWVQDYVYIPMGGNRKGPRRATVNTFAAMVLVGVWHGFGLHYALFGAYHAALLTLFRWWRTGGRDRIPLPEGRGGRSLAWLFTFIAIVLGWPIFVLPLDMAIHVYMKMFGLAYTGFDPSVFLAPEMFEAP